MFNLFGSNAGTRRRTRRTFGYEQVGSPGAEVRVVGGECLEPRAYMAGITAAAVVGSAIAGNAVAQDAQVGSVLYKSAPIGITDPRGAEYANGVVTVAGNNGNLGVSQIYTLSSGQVGSLTTFWSQSVAAGGGSGANQSSFIFDVNLLADGRLVFLGSSANNLLNGNPNYWFTPNSPISTAPFASDSGIVDFATPSGVMGGYLNNPAAVGSLTAKFANLPGAENGSAVTTATDDDRYLVGLGIWKQVQAGTLNYARIDTSTWQEAPNGGGVPVAFQGVVKVGTRYLVAGEFLEGETFTPQVGVWDVETGKLVGATSSGDSFADFRVIEGVAVLGVNGDTGGVIYVMPSSGGLGNRLDLSAKLGYTDDRIVRGSFFKNELGMVINAGGNTRVVSLDFITTAQQTAVQVTAGIRTYGLGGNTPSYYGYDLIQIQLKGSADVDFTRIDWRKLQLTSSTGSGSVTPLIGIVSKVDRDKYQDLTLYFWMPQLRANKVVAAPKYGETSTSVLNLSGVTKQGVEFFGEVSLTVDSLPWWQRRARNLLRF